MSGGCQTENRAIGDDVRAIRTTRGELGDAERVSPFEFFETDRGCQTISFCNRSASSLINAVMRCLAR